MDNFQSILSNLVDKIAGWGESTIIMLPNLVVALIVLAFFFVAARWVGRAVAGVFNRITDNEQIAGLLSVVASVGTRVIGLFIALGLLQLDKTVTSLLAGVGVIGLALGFAFQDIAANFMSGIIMALHRPFRVGDQVELAGHNGTVESIQLRSTQVTTLTGLSILIPNKDVFQNAIVNYTATEQRRLDVAVGVAYDSDLEAVRDIAARAAKSVPFRDERRAPEVFYGEFGDSSINFNLRIWLTRPDEKTYLLAKSEAIIAVKKAFDANGITIPFPIRTLDFGASAVGGAPIEAMKLHVVSND